MTANDTAPSIFESFNARALEPHQVARTFVPSQHYRILAKRAHTVIVGPRGSGKTTLLKMLQQEALEAWNHPEAAHYRGTVDFTGAFIGTDVSWGAQLDALGHGRLDADTHRVFSVAAFTTHVLRSLVHSMYHRVYGPPLEAIVAPHRRLVLSKEKEVEFVRALASHWRLSLSLPTLLSLKHGLTARMADIHERANEEAIRGSSGRSERLASVPYLLMHFLSAALLCAEMFDDSTGYHSSRWALLFDELELAPQWIREELFRSLRSVDSRFLFKLSMSPFNADAIALEQALSAMPGNDYDAIPLWYAHKEDGSPFCRELWDAMLKERRIPPTLPEIILGKSEFETMPDEWTETGTAYSPGSRLQKRIVRAAETDPSFDAYLKQKDIDPNSLHKLEGDVRAAEIRKVAPLLVVREAFRSPPNKTAKGRRQDTRSRKNPTVYSGAASLFAIVEGNPRWFIGIIGRLLDGMGQNVRPVPLTRQSKEIAASTDRFSAMLRTIPCGSKAAGRSGKELLSLLDGVGHFIFRAVVVEEFNADPPGSFTVDSHVSEDLLSSLGLALNAGAIVYVPDEHGDILLKSLRGKRFRLSYLLAPRFHIPIRLGRAVSLSRMLEAGGDGPTVQSLY